MNIDNTNTRLGEHLRVLRQNAKMTAAEMSSPSNRDKSHVTKVETGANNTAAIVLDDFARELGCQLEFVDIVTGEVPDILKPYYKGRNTDTLPVEKIIRVLAELADCEVTITKKIK